MMRLMAGCCHGCGDMRIKEIKKKYFTQLKKQILIHTV